MENITKLRKKIIAHNPKKWWGDDFDVRFYLISKVKNLKNKRVLDIGGGTGVISFEIDSSNQRINLDYSFQELRNCNKIDNKISNISSEMTNLPFLENTFDCVISSSVLQYAKDLDIKNNEHIIKNEIKEYPHVEKSLMEINRVLKKGGILFLVTPNDLYYKSYMLNYNELNNAMKNHFLNYTITLYNTFPKLSKKYRKLNLANIIPKILSKIMNEEKIINNILIKKKENKKKNSVAFYVEAKK
jgi:ubiquinone/menaquinone biosynthesis C-methylase UbiE